MQKDQPNVKFAHVYAVLRIYQPLDPDMPENNLAIVKVFASRPAADHEVERLGEINGSKGYRYLVITSRFVPGSQHDKN